jgi:hypothetical protein
MFPQLISHPFNTLELLKISILPLKSKIAKCYVFGGIKNRKRD